MTNTLDAVASRDFLLEALAAAAVMGATLSRIAQDLYVWSSDEFGAVDFPDRTAGTSSIIPQKKNPIVLERIKSRTAHTLGAFTAAVAVVRNTNYTNVIDANREGLRQAWPALEELRATRTLGRACHIADEAVRQALDPVRHVELRAHAGGPAPLAVRTMVETGRDRLLREREALEGIKRRIARGQEELAAEAARLLELG